MALAIFDLDNTLLAGDSDHMWGRFLAELGVVDAVAYQRENDRYYQAYQQGGLDILEYLRFALKPLSDHEPQQLQQWRAVFLRERIEPIILPAGLALIKKHRDGGDTPVIITATNSFITAPIAERLGIEHLIATEPAMENGRYTGEVAGVPCYREGKVTRINAWLSEHNSNLRGSSFYSDSHNDIPLLDTVDHPVAVDPDQELDQYARDRGWPVISLRR